MGYICVCMFICVMCNGVLHGLCAWVYVCMCDV